MPTPAKPPIRSRSAPIFGVCEALGDDFGISANWFRALLAPLMIWQPIWTLVGYFAVGALVLATRLIWPDVREPMPSAATTNDDQQVTEDLRLAA